MGKDTLFQLARNNKIEEFGISLSDSEINLTNEFDQNLLQEAIAHNAKEIGKYLLKKNINVNHQDRQGQTPLHYTALYRDALLAEKILKKSGRIDIRDNYGNTALWTAVFNAKRSYDIVRLFLKFNADPFFKNNAGRSPFDFANQINDKPLVSMLKNIDLNGI